MRQRDDSKSAMRLDSASDNKLGRRSDEDEDGG